MKKILRKESIPAELRALDDFYKMYDFDEKKEAVMHLLNYIAENQRELINEGKTVVKYPYGITLIVKQVDEVIPNHKIILDYIGRAVIKLPFMSRHSFYKVCVLADE